MAGRLLTAFEVAERLGFSPETVRRWTRSGELPARRIGGRLRYPEDEIELWLQGRATTEQGVVTHPASRRRPVGNLPAVTHSDHEQEDQ